MNNPYASPVADMHAGLDETYEPSLFALRGRVGRLRFLVYTILPAYAVLMLLGLSALLSGRAPVGGTATPKLLALLAVALAVVTALRRLDDLNHSRWWGLLLLVPPVNVFVWCYLLIVSGSETANKRGPAPAPNTVMVKLGAMLAVPLLLGTLWAGYAMVRMLPVLR
ncbi:DUF805 domain-containing protein [Massilia pseudoviolaceinigra]|uniref:DUF805 domain-containing protein n=1 Tax=Massilia pseudoviolaceinigra TaxID=3057165 RepID=UPI002796CD63|nr:DUF805 domain-containing protein [Massilia sp. CCM 9206]MDQ1919632.1 DUF805 domain-containing protein [Massilia sp. CCM 9206]